MVATAVGLESAKDLIADLDQALRPFAVTDAAAPVADPAADTVHGPDFNDEGSVLPARRNWAALSHAAHTRFGMDFRLIRWICGKPIRSHVVDGKQVTRPTTIAVVGLSNKEGRPSFRVARKMVRFRARSPFVQAAACRGTDKVTCSTHRPVSIASPHLPFVQQRLGYKIIPINPMLKEVLNEPAYPSLAAVNVPVDVVQVFRSKDQVIPVAEESTPTLCAPHRGPAADFS